MANQRRWSVASREEGGRGAERGEGHVAPKGGPSTVGSFRVGAHFWLLQLENSIQSKPNEMTNVPSVLCHFPIYVHWLL